MALLHVNFFSEVLGMSTQMEVILPQEAHAQIGMGSNAEQGKWKVLYLLHGLSDDHTIWQRRTSIERYAADLPLAVVMPTTHRGWYTDMRCGFKWFTYISQELPKVCAAFFPGISTAREDSFVCGLSMGGYGAMKLALRCPDRYAKAASLSGALDVAQFAENYAQSGNREFEDIFGPLESIRGSENDLFALANRIKNDGTAEIPKLFMSCGTEDFLYWQNVRMRNQLRALDIPVTYEEKPGTHNWEYWDDRIQAVLKWLFDGEVN